MEHLDEHEMLIQYSEMTAFDFDSKEFQKIREDYVECRSFVTKFFSKMNRVFDSLIPAKSM